MGHQNGPIKTSFLPYNTLLGAVSSGFTFFNAKIKVVLSVFEHIHNTCCIGITVVSSTVDPGVPNLIPAQSYQGSHRLEKYLNFKGFLDKSLKIKSALKST